MVNRLILAMMLFGATTAHAQVAGSGGALSVDSAKETQRRTTALLPKRADAQPAKMKVTQRQESPRSAAAASRPQPAKPRTQPAVKGR